MSKRVVPREQALRDVDAAIDHYAAEAGEVVALGFVDALESVYDAISRRPATGSLQYANALSLPDLRHRALRRFPYLVFYVEDEDRIDVWRVLHMARDIPASL